MAEWDFSGDEALFMFAAGATTAVGFWRGFLAPLQVWSGGRVTPSRLAPHAVFAGMLTLLLTVLQTWGDPKYVVGRADYTLLFMLGGGAWGVLSLSAMSLLGLSLRDDAVERNNAAARVAICGGIAGAMLIYTFSNIGNGETIWTGLVPAGAASGIFFALWGLVARVSGAGEAVGVDRDVASGWRMMGLGVAAGLVLGRATAGDFESWGATFHDLVAQGWPVLLVGAVAGMLNRLWRPTPERPRRERLAFGIVPAMVLILAAGVYVASLGRPVVAPVGARTDSHQPLPSGSEHR